MNGRRLVTGFLVFLAIFVVGLVYAQFFAYYQRDRATTHLVIDGVSVPVADYDGIDSSSSPLKLRGCFRIDPAAVAALGPAPKPTPLTPPFWFGCFDAGQLTTDIATGAARAHVIETNSPDGFDLMLAVYPDGRGYLWRQFNARFAE